MKAIVRFSACDVTMQSPTSNLISNRVVIGASERRVAAAVTIAIVGVVLVNASQTVTIPVATCLLNTMLWRIPLPVLTRVVAAVAI